MRAVDIIIKKRDGGELTRQELDYFVAGLTSGTIPDYQLSAWAMAVVFRGMTLRETADLTLAMAHSGEVLDLSAVSPRAGMPAHRHAIIPSMMPARRELQPQAGLRCAAAGGPPLPAGA